ncbi:MAG: hypothetical protein AAF933_08745 [Pseudomonadota bacterium]
MTIIPAAGDRRGADRKSSELRGWRSGADAMDEDIAASLLLERLVR